MRVFRIIAIILVLFCFIPKSYSQGSFSIHFGTSIPVSDFASDDFDDDDAGGAAIGFNVGLQYIYPISEVGLGIFGGIDFNYNGLTKDIKDDIEDFFEYMGIYDVDIKYYKYLNIPITFGLNYTYQADDYIGVFANAGIAVNFFKVTDWEIKADGETVTSEFDLAYSIGFKFGGGILIGQRASISIDYLGLGKHDVNGELTNGGSEDIDAEQKVDILTATFGIRF